MFPFPLILLFRFECGAYSILAAGCILRANVNMIGCTSLMLVMIGAVGYAALNVIDFTAVAAAAFVAFNIHKKTSLKIILIPR